jgi:hypothetical protein
MFEFSVEALRNNAPILIGIAAIISTYILAYIVNWWRLRKSLSYEIKTNASLVNVHSKVKDDIEIFYKKEPISNLRLFIIKVINDGRQPIEKKDFDKGLDFILGNEAQIISVEVKNEKPENLRISHNFAMNEISIDPVLLNSKDSFELQILVKSEDDTIKCDGRISGISEIRLDSFDPREYMRRADKYLLGLNTMLVASYVFGSNFAPMLMGPALGLYTIAAAAILIYPFIRKY